MCVLFKYIVCCLFLFIIGICYDHDGPEVQIQQGKLKGIYMKTKKSKLFSAFLGIPYAEPPIGNLRFSDPVPAKSWEGTRNGQKDSEVCIQRNPYTRSEIIEGVEDCLYLNVYTPNEKETQEKYAVMIFFHGGGWICGAGISKWYGPDILLEHDVVLVVLNFRLGPLGFLSTGDDSAPGNFGLKDQTLAMSWVKNNIDKFGGDPERITIFGESAGGASVHFHMMSPLSRGLFNYGISESGTGLSSWALGTKQEAQENSNKLAKLLNCTKDTSKETIDCLKTLDARSFVEIDKEFMFWDYDPMIPFKPVIEHEHKNAFLTKHPVEYILKGEVLKVPWITGITASEGAIRTAGIFANPKYIEDLNTRFDELVPISLFYNQTSGKDLITKQIKEFYFQDKPVGDSTFQNLMNMYTDAWFLESLDKSVRLHLSKNLGDVFVYYFSYRGSSSFSEVFGDPFRDYGACHADELQYLFPVGDGLFPNVIPSSSDKKIAEILSTLWTSFAKQGNPSSEIEDEIQIKWEPVSSTNFEYLHIKSNDDIQMEKGLLPERAAFWSSLSVDSVNIDDFNKIKTEL